MDPHTRDADVALGHSPQGLSVHHDQDPVFTGYGWIGRLLPTDQVRVSYGLDGPQDNPEMESFFGRFKTENGALIQEARDLAELQAIVGKRIRYSNRIRRHSALGNEASWAVLQKLVCARDA